MAKKSSRDIYDEERRPVKKSSGRSSGSRYDDEERYSAPKKKKSSAKKKKEQAKKKRRRIVLFIVEIFALVLLVGALWVVQQGSKSGKMELNEDKIIVNEVVKEKEETTMKGYRNIALFGVDSTTGSLSKGTRSDTIMIASINQDTGECKLVSVYRDTYLNLSNDTYNKCNSAYAKGGPEMAISMLNLNLDLNITDFVTVGFAGLTDTIDALGGVYIDVKDNEISHLNNYQLCIADDLKRSYTPVTSSGRQLLDGLQATGYCRVRYIAGGDFTRAEHQRNVLSAVADQAKQASPAALAEVANNVFSEVYTSLDLAEIVELLADVGNYTITETAGFPREENRTTGKLGTKGDCVIPVNLEENVKWLHQFLFNDYEYTPSDMVQECSRQIEADTGKTVN